MDGTPRLTRTYRKLVRGTNINETSLLATDYLNHFNEIVMLLELVPDMPEMIEEAQDWEPATYIQHFEASAFSDKDLAVWAYKNAPPEYIEAFEELVSAANEMIERARKQIGAIIKTGDQEALQVMVPHFLMQVRDVLDRISAVINGTVMRLDQSEPEDTAARLDQSAIDDLFD